MNDTIKQRIAIVRERIAAAARAANRSPDEITLVAVTKTRPASAVAAALAAGVADMGENRVQEASEKIAQLAEQRNATRWHLIGHLQRNKARQAAELFDMVHSLDSLRLAEALARFVAEREARGRADTRHETRDTEISSSPGLASPGLASPSLASPSLASPSLASPSLASPSLASPSLASPGLDVLLQVNVSGEASKEGFDLPGGVANAALSAFLADVERILALPGLRVCGLMTVAPWGSDPEAARPTFRALHMLRDELARRFPQADLSHLSMGMTDDFPVAIAEGATIVRVGRAIFGERERQ